MSYTATSDYFLTDGGGNLYAYQNSGINNFPYLTKATTSTTQNSGSYSLWGDPNFSSQYSGTYGANQSDLTGAYGQYGPQSWRIGSTTTAVFYTGKNYTGSSKTYAPGSSESNTFAVNGSPFLSVSVSTPAYTYQKIQQVGTIVNGVNQYWTFDQVQANMIDLINAAQSSNSIPSATTAAKLTSAVNALTCKTYTASVTPSIPDTVCTIPTTTPTPTTPTTKPPTTTTPTTSNTSISSTTIGIIVAAVLLLLGLVVVLLLRKRTRISLPDASSSVISNTALR